MVRPGLRRAPGRNEQARRDNDNQRRRVSCERKSGFQGTVALGLAHAGFGCMLRRRQKGYAARSDRQHLGPARHRQPGVQTGRHQQRQPNLSERGYRRRKPSGRWLFLSGGHQWRRRVDRSRKPSRLASRCSISSRCCGLSCRRPSRRICRREIRPRMSSRSRPERSTTPPASPRAWQPTRFSTIENLLDTNRDQKIEASELRQAVQTEVSTLFLMADTNQDGQLSPYELNAAVGEIAKSAMQSGFQAADRDRNNMLEHRRVRQGPGRAGSCGLPRSRRQQRQPALVGRAAEGRANYRRSDRAACAFRRQATLCRTRCAAAAGPMCPATGQPVQASPAAGLALARLPGNLSTDSRHIASAAGSSDCWSLPKAPNILGPS